jgi:hypothetical protein
VSVRERLENHIVYVVLVVGVAAFSAGVAAYKAILEIAQLESVPKNELQELRRAKETSHPPSAIAVGCVTGEATEVRSDSAQLIGSPSGPRTKEWFDFGTSENELPEIVLSVRLEQTDSPDAVEGRDREYKAKHPLDLSHTRIACDTCSGQIHTFISTPK